MVLSRGTILTCPDEINVRNVHDLKDSTIPLDEFIAHCREVPPCAPEGGMSFMQLNWTSA